MTEMVELASRCTLTRSLLPVTLSLLTHPFTLLMISHMLSQVQSLSWTHGYALENQSEKSKCLRSFTLTVKMAANCKSKCVCI